MKTSVLIISAILGISLLQIVAPKKIESASMEIANSEAANTYVADLLWGKTDTIKIGNFPAEYVQREVVVQFQRITSKEIPKPATFTRLLEPPVEGMTVQRILEWRYRPAKPEAPVKGN